MPIPFLPFSLKRGYNKEKIKRGNVYEYSSFTFKFNKNRRKLIVVCLGRHWCGGTFDNHSAFGNSQKKKEKLKLLFLGTKEIAFNREQKKLTDTKNQLAFFM